MKFVKVALQGEQFNITLNRPDKRNAFHPQMISEITEAFHLAGKEPKAKYVFLSGEGKSFCSGGDLDWMKSMKEYSLEENIEDSKALFEMFRAGYELDLPVLGKLHGHVMGGAIGLAAICDVVAAEEKTLFCFSEVKWGLVPAVISPFVTRKIKKSRADQLMLTAKLFSASEALEAGLIHFSGSEDQVTSFINDQLKLLSQAAPIALKDTKKLLKKIEGFDPNQVLDSTTQVIAKRRVSEEGQKGLQFFLDKQTPDWS